MLPDYRLVGRDGASKTDAAFNPQATCKGFVCCRKSECDKYRSRRRTAAPREAAPSATLKLGFAKNY